MKTFSFVLLLLCSLSCFSQNRVDHHYIYPYNGQRPQFMSRLYDSLGREFVAGGGGGGGLSLGGDPTDVLFNWHGGLSGLSGMSGNVNDIFHYDSTGVNGVYLFDHEGGGFSTGGIGFTIYSQHFVGGVFEGGKSHIFIPSFGDFTDSVIKSGTVAMTSDLPVFTNTNFQNVDQSIASLTSFDFDTGLSDDSHATHLVNITMTTYDVLGGEGEPDPWFIWSYFFDNGGTGTYWIRVTNISALSKTFAATLWNVRTTN